MARGRKAIPVDVTLRVLHEAGYKCSNPTCRYPITLDRHHLLPHSAGGPDTAANLLALCPNCHTEHHDGKIPEASLRAWKMLLITINEAFDRRTIDLLIAIHKYGKLRLTGGECAPLIASNLATILYSQNQMKVYYDAILNERGKLFVEGWIAGNQEQAIPPELPPVN